MTLAVYLLGLRRLARMTQPQWAAKCGVTRMTVYRWETDRVIPYEHELNRALAAFPVSAQERRAAHFLREQSHSRRRQATTPVDAATTPQDIVSVHRGDFLQALRKRKGWTRAQTVRALGISRSSLSRWERYQAWPPEKTMRHLASALGASGWELVAMTAPLTPSK